MNSLMKAAINPRGPLLSEAARHGISLRGESHQERFCHVEGRGLTSDFWGAACEAVQPAVATFNWHTKDKFEFGRVMSAFCAIQHHYFETYWQMPARCPGSQQRFVQQGGRIVRNVLSDNPVLKLYDNPETVKTFSITSECDRVEHLAGMADHLFYAHGWSREKVLEAVVWYENQRAAGVLTAVPLQNFEHLQVN